MRSRIWSLLLLGVTLVGTAACATPQEWAEWYQHPTHYASWHHLGFSARNREGTAPRVFRRDIEASRTQNWWGKVIMVSPEQIFQG